MYNLSINKKMQANQSLIREKNKKFDLPPSGPPHSVSLVCRNETIPFPPFPAWTVLDLKSTKYWDFLFFYTLQ
jgi:hypothetical protein